MLMLIIHGRLPGLNDYIGACRTYPQSGAKMKKEAEELITRFINRQMKGVKVTRPVKIEFLWVEKDRRRDPDNICGFGHKVILDALVKAGVLPDDSGKYIKGFKDSFSVDNVFPRIEVTIRRDK